MNTAEREQSLIRQCGLLRSEVVGFDYSIQVTGDAIHFNRGLLKQRDKARVQSIIDEQEERLKRHIAHRSKLLEEIAAIEVQLQAIWNPSPAAAVVQVEVASAEPVAVGATDDPFASLDDSSTEDF